MKLTKYLKGECFLLDIKEEEKDKVLLKFSNLLKEKGIIKNNEEIYCKLVEREKIQSTGIGNGVAIPHCFSDEVKDLIIVIARSKKGLNFNSLDQKPARLIFLLLGNRKQPGLHLKALAHIARLIKETEIVKKLINCSSVEEMKRIFEEEEGKI